MSPLGLASMEVIRSLEAEYVAVLGQGIQVLRKALTLILEQAPPSDDFSSGVAFCILTNNFFVVVNNYFTGYG